MKNIFIIFGLFGTPVFAESPAPLKFENKQGQVIGRTLPGFHFNDKAPNRMQIQNQWVKPQSVQTSEMTFLLPKVASGKKSSNQALTETYVCDDAKTFCETHKVTVELIETAFLPRFNSTHDENGFIKDDLRKALAFAKKSKQLVLIDFGAPWCPPCLRLEAEVFPSEQFQKSVRKNFILAKIDVDRIENKKVMDQYSVKAFPTMIVVDAKGEELHRFLDFVTADVLVAELNLVATGPRKSLLQLEKSANAGDRASLLALFKRARHSLKHKEALDYLKKMNDSTSIDFFQTKIDSLGEDAGKDSMELIGSYKQALLKYPEDFQAIQWGLDLAERLKGPNDIKEKKQVLDQAQKLTMDWIENSATRLPQAFKKGDLVELGNLALPEFYSQLAQIEELRENKAASLLAFEKAADEVLKLNPSADHPMHILYLARYLKKFKPYQEVETWYVKLQERYPQDYTYFYRHANLLFENNKWSEAKLQIVKAKALAYGKNLLQVEKLQALIDAAIVKASQNEKKTP